MLEQMRISYRAFVTWLTSNFHMVFLFWKLNKGVLLKNNIKVSTRSSHSVNVEKHLRFSTFHCNNDFIFSIHLNTLKLVS